MHIRKLELQGFKSFPNRTSFHFGPGVSGVVGPNGCGKSNVVDAVKWCLGEQSAKSLRGRSMDDIIFAGSESRKAMGVAEVSLTFEAGDEPFAGEFARCEEIQITRRLFRDGNSEYLINQSRCRLRDIQDIFRDTGASNRLYSFIEQGRIGEIVKAKPEQRRSLIEEAAGISRYKAKKRETEQRLEGTNRNLERATDLVEDLAGRLRALKRQVNKATRYRRLRTEVKQGEVYLGLARYGGLAGDRKVVAERLWTTTQTEEAKRRELARQDEEIGTHRDAVEVMEQALGDLRDELGELEATRRERESARMYQGREASQLTERIERLSRAKEDSEKELSVSQARRVEAQAEVDGVRASADGVRERVSEAVALADQAELAVQSRRQRIESAKAEVLELIRSLARDRASKEASRLRKEDINGRIADLGFRIQVAKDNLGDHVESLEAARTADEATRAALAEAQGRAQASSLAMDEARQATERARVARRQAETQRVDVERRVSQTRGRLESLQALAAAHDGVEEHAKKALSVSGVLGTLADHLDVPEAMEDLVATAVGDELQYVLVPDAETALRVAKVTEGRVNMLLVGDDRAGGTLATIGGSEAAGAALNRILGDAKTVQSLEEAIALHQSGGGAFLVESGPTGLPVVVTPRGEIRIGPAKTRATMVLQRRRELAALGERLPELEAEEQGAIAALEAAEAAQESARESFEHAQSADSIARQGAGEAMVAHRTAEAERARLEKGQSEREAAVQSLVAEKTSLEEMLGKLSSQQNDLAGAIEAAAAAQNACEERLHQDQSALVSEESDAKDKRQVAVVARTELAGIEQRITGLTQIVSAAQQAEDAAARQVATCTRDIESAKNRIKDLTSEDQKLVDTLAEITETQAELRGKIEAAKQNIATARTALKGAEDSVRGLRDAREAATTQRMDLERQLDQIKAEIAQIRAQLDERYQISVTGLLDRLERNGQVVVQVPEEARAVVAEGGSDEESIHVEEDLEDLCIKPSMLENLELIEEWVQRLSEAKRKLERLGEVNLVAVQEYAEVKTRHDTLEAQRADLEESVRSIRNTIAQLNRTCRERFRETFDRVNVLFKDGYPKLVGGGRAQLVLTDEEDMLETGVDIEVQPPGKRLQNLALLSGGEMAMTAIALIFALFQVKPSPFCLLDEVDAPLDEANGARFNNLLREMAKLSQFIVITHNKKTMECVDTLYGVTMPNAGVSQLVSVKLD